MPRKARIGDPGVLQHIIVCKIERRRGFSDDHDQLLCSIEDQKFCLLKKRIRKLICRISSAFLIPELNFLVAVKRNIVSDIPAGVRNPL